MNMTTEKKTVAEVLKGVRELAGRAETFAESLSEQAARLERDLKLARGTRERKAAGTQPPTTTPEAPTPELMSQVATVLSQHPMTFQELLAVTGARDNRVKGVLMRLQRDGVRLVNLGTENKALWFIPSDEVWVRLENVMRSRRGR